MKNICVDTEHCSLLLGRNRTEIEQDWIVFNTNELQNIEERRQERD